MGDNKYTIRYENLLTDGQFIVPNDTDCLYIDMSMDMLWTNNTDFINEKHEQIKALMSCADIIFQVPSIHKELREMVIDIENKTFTHDLLNVDLTGFPNFYHIEIPVAYYFYDGYLIYSEGEKHRVTIFKYIGINNGSDKSVPDIFIVKFEWESMLKKVIETDTYFPKNENTIYKTQYFPIVGSMKDAIQFIQNRGFISEETIQKRGKYHIDENRDVKYGIPKEIWKSIFN